MGATAPARIPLPALMLGAGGLIPFMGGAALHILTHDPRWLPLLSGYGAVILSFVGALHWGYAVRDEPHGASAWWRYGWSVLPALMAWVCLMLAGTVQALALATGLIICLVVDEAFARSVCMPPWLMPLRRLLTAGGALSLLVAGVA
jgi:hypothetical protein